jgi:hypothetical protein
MTPSKPMSNVKAQMESKAHMTEAKARKKVLIRVFFCIPFAFGF